jgi:hypothetical protein
MVVKIELVHRDGDFRLPKQFAQSENGPSVLDAFVPVTNKDLVQHLDGLSESAQYTFQELVVEAPNWHRVEDQMVGLLFSTLV